MSYVVVYNALIPDGSQRLAIVYSKHIDSFESAVTFGENNVPTGVPFKVFHTSELPEFTEYRDSWYMDDIDFTDGVGA